MRCSIRFTFLLVYPESVLTNRGSRYTRDGHVHLTKTGVKPRQPLSARKSLFASHCLACVSRCYHICYQEEMRSPKTQTLLFSTLTAATVTDQNVPFSKIQSHLKSHQPIFEKEEDDELSTATTFTRYTSRVSPHF